MEIEKEIDEVSKAICQLFPKSTENPDGYEPKPDNRRLVDEYMMLLPSQNGSKAIVDTRRALILQDAKNASIKDAEIKELKEFHQIELQTLGEDLTDRYRLRIERFIGELEAPCPHMTYPLDFRSKRFCDICWETFKKQEGIGGS